MNHIVENYLAKTTRVKKVRERKRCNTPQKADKEIKYCITCTNCWERKAKPDNSTTLFNWYEDFPAYGKEHKICPKCQSKNN